MPEDRVSGAVNTNTEAGIQDLLTINATCIVLDSDAMLPEKPLVSEIK